MRTEPGDLRSHPRRYREGFQESGTYNVPYTSHMGTECQEGEQSGTPEVGEGGPELLQEGGSGCVGGRGPSRSTRNRKGVSNSLHRQ